MSKTLPLEPVDARGYALLRESFGLLNVDDWAIFAMRGEDRKAWLQGQATNDLRQLKPGGALGFCICSPTGQMLAICTAFSLEDRYLILTPGKCARAFAERVDSMVIMEDVSCEEVTQHYVWKSIQGPSATNFLASVGEPPTMDVAEKGGSLFLRFDRTGLGGWDVLFEKGANESGFTLGGEHVSNMAVEVARLEAGIPVFGRDVNERTLPPEVGHDFEAKYVSFTKGCYTGQEVLMRIHSRGHTNKTWAGFLLDAPVEVGNSISTDSREECGTITSASFSPKFGPVGAGMLRNESAQEGAEIVVRGAAGDIRGEVVEMPILRR